MSEKIRVGVYHWVFPGGSESAVVYNLLNNCSNSVESTFYCKSFEGNNKNFVLVKGNSYYLLFKILTDLLNSKFDFFILPISSAETIHFQLIKKLSKMTKTKLIFTAGLLATEKAVEILGTEKSKYFDESTSSAYWLDEKEKYFRIENSKKCIPENEKEYLIVPSLFLKSLIDSNYNKNIFVINHGCDSIKRIAHKKHKGFRILFVGNGATRKGLDYLIDAYKELKKQGYDVDLTVVSSWITDFKEKDIKLLSHVSEKKLAELYSSHDVFVLPSILDGWGLVVTEAMSHGLPVVVSKNTGVKEIIKDGSDGFVIPTRSVSSIKKVIIKLMNSKFRNKISKRALAKVKFISWKTQSDKLVKLLRDLK